jgi:hypothetical protein
MILRQPWLPWQVLELQKIPGSLYGVWVTRPKALQAHAVRFLEQDPGLIKAPKCFVDIRHISLGLGHTLMTVATAADPGIERFLIQLQQIAVLSLLSVNDTHCIQIFTMKLKV